MVDTNLASGDGPTETANRLYRELVTARATIDALRRRVTELEGKDSDWSAADGMFHRGPVHLPPEGT